MLCAMCAGCLRDGLGLWSGEQICKVTNNTDSAVRKDRRLCGVFSHVCTRFLIESVRSTHYASGTVKDYRATTLHGELRCAASM